MECLSELKIQEYVDGNLNNVESAMIRDHIIQCDRCRKIHNEYEALEQILFQPIEITPPPIIEQNVLRTLFPKIPTYSSIFALIAASFVLMVTSIYIYFDFSHNSLVEAFNLTSSTTTSWIGSIIRFISAVFSVMYTLFKILSRLMSILLDINIGAEIIGASLLLFGLAGFYLVSRFTYRHIRK